MAGGLTLGGLPLADDLILRMAYKEAKALFKLGARPASLSKPNRQ